MAGLKGIPATYGGVERAVEEIGARLADRGHDVSVFCRSHYTPETVTVHRGMRLVRLPSWRTRTLDTLSHTALSAIRSRNERFDLVHLHSLGNAPIVPLFRGRGRRVVLTLHGLEWVQSKWKGTGHVFFRLCERPAVRWPDVVTSVSRHWGQDLARRMNRPVRYIPNGVAVPEKREPDLLRTRGLEPGRYVLFLARLVPEKGAHHLITAFRKLETSMRLVIAGDAERGGEYAHRLRALADGDDRIVFTGFVYGHLWNEFLSHAYATVHPSESEGLSIGLMEAMAFGNCVLVSDIAENLEVVGEEAGVRFRSRDPEHLREVLAGLLAAPERVNVMRRKAAEHVRRQFDWDRIVDEYETLFRSVLAPSLQGGKAEGDET